MVQVYNEKRTEDFKDRITEAYYTAYFQRFKKLPKLEKVLKSIDSGRKKKKRMTEQEMLGVFQRMAATFDKEPV